MTKSEIRSTYKSLRRNLTPDRIDQMSLEIANRVLHLDIWDGEFYHVFLSIEEQMEINTDYILSVLSGKDKNIVISKSDFKTREMTHYLLTDGTLIKKNKWNIPEPVNGIAIDSKQIDVIFIPLLAFDNSGHRVGYGKGFYDKFLAECHPDTKKIGLSFFKSIELIEDVNASDMSLDLCITPEQTYIF
ncbi:MAG: 5-formyltetrahydrofolate cyclo-ligase [Psychroserpens sp.]|nr:5-formyltetrahydrofolate cyclo-ligase [Psychroserpens sp.]MBO6630030.1 5-formyltetrahydrofolate cyclo-ligase [Psychroserpens sp.]MBO6653620.1 5-formyltetrahydrofolate cyclo-ligase [Psychroserpens sp.]MBO6681941.1 5-formyltetrahydrofolate cyclo-ligase [Psychroserpens sp.]MBO6748945.1 5-formyltetrahydrofolate cyclo-ligase [Psychroserpens sp.]